jgi:hypothetical protein
MGRQLDDLIEYFLSTPVAEDGARYMRPVSPMIKRQN